MGILGDKERHVLDELDFTNIKDVEKEKTTLDKVEDKAKDIPVPEKESLLNDIDKVLQAM